MDDTVKNILVVDDTIENIQVLGTMLRDQGFQVNAAQNGKQALDMVGTVRPDLILLDVMMPEMDGFEACRKLKGDVDTRDIPIIFLTAKVESEDVVRGFEIGAVDYVTKPFNKAELLQRVRTHLELRDTHVSLECALDELEVSQELTEMQNDQLSQMNDTLEQRVRERTAEVLRLNEQLGKSFLGTIQVMAQLTELHSPVIGSHGKRVAQLCRLTARELDLSEADVSHLAVAATLHDVGKGGMDPAVLQESEARLTQEERSQLQSHVVKGETLLLKVPNLEKAAEIVRHHHESFDGSGYPDRLSGNTIPLGARILAVANVYDNALNNKTTYGSATPEGALRMAKSLTIETLDPDIVRVFIEVIGKQSRDANHGLDLEVGLKDLRVGMVLSRDLRASRGGLVLEKDCELKQSELARIQRFQETDPIMDGFYVYRGQSSGETG